MEKWILNGDYARKFAGRENLKPANGWQLALQPADHAVRRPPNDRPWRNGGQNLAKAFGTGGGEWLERRGAEIVYRRFKRLGHPKAPIAYGLDANSLQPSNSHRFAVRQDRLARTEQGIV
jgi:hypothetical protein